MGLHALQDYYAHGQTGNNDSVDELFPNHLEQKNVDNINYDWTDDSQKWVEESNEQKRYNDTRTETEKYLNEYLNGSTKSTNNYKRGGHGHYEVFLAE